MWALGISAVEMAEVAPPRWAVHPMRVIFMISRDPPPQLADRDRWSLPFHDFVAQCLQKARPEHVSVTGAHQAEAFRDSCFINSVPCVWKAYETLNITSMQQAPCISCPCHPYVLLCHQCMALSLTRCVSLNAYVTLPTPPTHVTVGRIRAVPQLRARRNSTLFRPACNR